MVTIKVCVVMFPFHSERSIASKVHADVYSTVTIIKRLLPSITYVVVYSRALVEHVIWNVGQLWWSCKRRGDTVTSSYGALESKSGLEDIHV